MKEEHRSVEQGPCGRRVNPDLCRMQHEKDERIWKEREKWILKMFESQSEKFEAKALSDAQAMVVKATSDLVTETRMREFVKSSVITWPQIFGAITVSVVLLGFILRLIGH